MGRRMTLSNRQTSYPFLHSKPLKTKGRSFYPIWKFGRELKHTTYIGQILSLPGLYRVNLRNNKPRCTNFKLGDLQLLHGESLTIKRGQIAALKPQKILHMICANVPKAQ